jgi:hypothetical protein
MRQSGVKFVRATWHYDNSQETATMVLGVERWWLWINAKDRRCQETRAVIQAQATEMDSQGS